MKAKHIQIIGVVLTSLFAVFIAFLYATAPRSLEELSSKATQTVTDAITTGQVITGTYEVNAEKFALGLQLFRNSDYHSARALFAEADPQRRDGRTQFYVAYSFYRQGWGRFSNDDELFRQGLEIAKRAQALLGNGFVSDDTDLQMKTPAALINELEEGLRVTAEDFHPFRVLNERK